MCFFANLFENLLYFGDGVSDAGPVGDGSFKGVESLVPEVIRKIGFDL